MLLVLGCVNGQAARLARRNVRLRNEMYGGHKHECVMQIQKDEKINAEIIFKVKENLVLEQSSK